MYTSLIVDQEHVTDNDEESNLSNADVSHDNEEECNLAIAEPAPILCRQNDSAIAVPEESEIVEVVEEPIVSQLGPVNDDASPVRDASYILDQLKKENCEIQVEDINSLQSALILAGNFRELYPLKTVWCFKSTVPKELIRSFGSSTCPKCPKCPNTDIEITLNEDSTRLDHSSPSTSNTGKFLAGNQLYNWEKQRSGSCLWCCPKHFQL